MYFVLERTLCTGGGAPAYSFVCAASSKEKAQETVKKIQDAEKSGFLAGSYKRTEKDWEKYSWKRDFIITQRVK